MTRRATFLAGVKRFLIMLVIASAVTAVAAVLLGLLVGSSLNRALSLGFYLVGSFGLLAGFFLGNRGPARSAGEGGGGFSVLGPRRVRLATLEERTTTLNDSAVFITLGFLLILIGLAIDSRVRLL